MGLRSELGKDWEMINTKVYPVECPRCHSINSLLTQEDCKEFKVCYHCGYVETDTKFDVTEFLVELAHNGINRDGEMAEVLTDEIHDRFDWLDFLDAELLAKMMVKSLAEAARFRAEAEDQEAAEFYHEKLEAAMGTY